MVFEHSGNAAERVARVSYPSGSIAESVFLWLCFSRQKPPCIGTITENIGRGGPAKVLQCFFFIWSAVVQYFIGIRPREGPPVSVAKT